MQSKIKSKSTEKPKLIIQNVYQFKQESKIQKNQGKKFNLISDIYQVLYSFNTNSLEVWGEYNSKNLKSKVENQMQHKNNFRFKNIFSNQIESNSTQQNEIISDSNRNFNFELTQLSDQSFNFPPKKKK